MSNNGNFGLVSRFWWIPLLTGLICIGLGIWCFCDPSTSIPTLAYVFAAFVIAAGLAYVILSILSRKVYSGWGWMLCVGLLELVCGIWLCFLPMPVLTIAFLYIIGIWILVVAVNGICEACMMSAVNPAWIIWAVLLLLCTVGFSIVFITNPLVSSVTEWMWLGLSLVMYGIYRISFSTRLRSLGRRTGGLL